MRQPNKASCNCPADGWWDTPCGRPGHEVSDVLKDGRGDWAMKDIEVQHIPQGDKALVNVPIDVCQKCWDDTGDLEEEFEEITYQLEEGEHLLPASWRGFTRLPLGEAAPKLSFEPCDKCGTYAGGDRFPVLMWRRITPLEELANTKGEER